MIRQDAELGMAAIMQVAELMCVAAHTAPKTCDVDHLVTAVLSGDDLLRLADKMEELGREYEEVYFIVNARSVRQAAAVVLIGTVTIPHAIKICGQCGMGSCAGMAKSSAHCAFDDVDLGIAIGSAVSVAADNRIDNRIMYSAGRAAMELEILGKKVINIQGIPLSVSGKNPFFDIDQDKL